MKDYFIVYFWIAFIVSFIWLQKQPTRMYGFGHFMGCVLAAMFGFLLWPIVVYGLYRAHKRLK